MHSHLSSKGRYAYHFNSDLSGDIMIVDRDSGLTMAEIPGADLKAIVARWVVSQKVARLEQLKPDGVLLDVQLPFSP